MPTPPLGRRFTHLLVASGLSNLADGLLSVGLPLLALSLTRSPVQISLVTVAFTTPWLLFSLHSGVLIDRYDRVRILALASLARILVLVVATGLAVTGSLTMTALLGLLVVFGTAEVFADSSAAALVPDVAPRARLGAANSRLMGLRQLANSFVGGPLAGLILALGTGWLFGIPAALCTAALLTVLRGLRGPAGTTRPSDGTAPGGPATSGPATTMRAELTHGLRYLWRHRVIRPLLVCATAMNFVNAGYFAVFPLWVVGPGSAVGLTPELYGLLAAALAGGALVGAVATERLQRHVREAPLIITSWTVNSALLLVPLVLPDARAIAGTFVLLGFTNMVGNVVNRTMRQQMVPTRLLGRVGGASQTLGYGCIPLGAALGGLIGEAFGLPVVFAGAVVMALAAAAWLARTVPQTAIDEAVRQVESTPATADGTTN